MAVDDSQAATALLTEHLQYTPLSLIDDIVDSVNNYIYQGIGSLETGLLSTPPERLGFKVSKSIEQTESSEPDYPDAKQEIDEGLHKLETLLNSTADKNFDKFEIYVLRNVLSVPANLANWIRLSHYEGIIHPQVQNPPTIESIELLRRKLAASRKVSRALLTEQHRNEAILGQLKAVLNPKVEDNGTPSLAFLAKSNLQQPLSGQQPLTTSTTFTLSQLPALKTAMNDLKEKLAQLDGLELGLLTAKDERREERRGYIEQRLKTHLEQNGRLGNSDSNSISGKRPETAEVEALEQAAKIFHPP